MIKKAVKIILSIVLIFSLCVQFSYIEVNAASSSIMNNGIYYIKNRRTGKYLTAAGTSANSNVYQGNFTGSTLQQFKFVRKEISTYTYYNIVSVANTSLLLDVNNANDANGTNIKLFTETTYTGAQYFRFIQTFSDTICSYRIMPKLSTTKVISVAAGSLLPNANVELYSNSSSYLYQDWVIERVATIDIENITPITIYSQEDSTTCGAACARMILAKHGVNVSETTIVTRAHNINSGEYGYTYVYVLVQVINDLLREYNVNTSYVYLQYSNVGAEVYELLFALAVENNMPVQIVIDNYSGTNTALPYRSDGHYVVVTGMKSDSSAQEPYICVSDPFTTTQKQYAGIWEIPVSELYNFSQRHSAYVIIEDSN